MTHVISALSKSLHIGFMLFDATLNSSKVKRRQPGELIDIGWLLYV